MTPPAPSAPVVLVGFMGAGKSTVGKLLAARLGVPFVDSDEAVEARAGRSVAQIFAADGEAAFRGLERRVVHDLVTGTGPAVLALGGGAVEDAGTRQVLGAARVVFLEASLEHVLARVGRDAGRPVLARPDLPDLFDARQAAYRAVAEVAVTTDGRDPAEVADEVLAALGSSGE